MNWTVTEVGFLHAFSNVSLNDFFVVVSKYQKSKHFVNTICFPSRNLLNNLRLLFFLLHVTCILSENALCQLCVSKSYQVCLRNTLVCISKWSLKHWVKVMLEAFTLSIYNVCICIYIYIYIHTYIIYVYILHIYQCIIRMYNHATRQLKIIACLNFKCI